MQALIEDDRFTYARDLLKMNTERAQKLVQMRPLDEQLSLGRFVRASLHIFRRLLTCVF